MYIRNKALHFNIIQLNELITASLEKKITKNYLLCTACDPKLMPSFPQHRNMKSSRREMNHEQTQDNQNDSVSGLSDLLQLPKRSRVD